MKQSIIYFYLMAKRLFKKPVFIIFLISLPILSVALKKEFTVNNINLCAGVYMVSDDPISNDIKNRILKSADAIKFVIADSEAELNRMVATGKCQCGYVIPANIDTVMDNGKARHSIKVIPGTYSIASITNEIVFSAIYHEYTLHILKNYIDETRLFKDYPTEEIHNEIDTLYDIYKTNGSTYSFKYTGDEALPKDASMLLPGYIILSVRGLLAIVIFASCFAGAIQLYQDRNNGIFRTRFGAGLHFAGISVILTPTLLISISCIAGLILSKSVNNIFKELFFMILYDLILTIIVYIFTLIIKSRTLFCGLLPVLLISSLIICPVFIDVCELDSRFTILQNCFPPTWYLKIFT